MYAAPTTNADALVFEWADGFDYADEDIAVCNGGDDADMGRVANDE